MLFQKKDSIKTSSSSSDTPLRKSDRRKLLSQLLQQYEHNSQMQEILQDVILSSKNNNCDVLKRKLYISKQDKKQQFNKNAFMYFRTPNTASKESFWKYNRTTHPIFLEIENSKKTKLSIPCLSILSLLPNLVPIIYIHSGTSKYICRGANLMSVGIISPEAIANALGIDYTLPKEIGSVVSICVYGNPIPFAVGIWEGIGNDNDGVAVTVLVGYGDDLWRMQCPKDGTTSDDVDDGNYGMVGFTNGTHVLPVIQDGNDAEEEVGVEGKEQTEESDDINSEENQDNNSKKDEDNGASKNNNIIDNTTDDEDIIEETNEQIIKLLYASFLQIKPSMLPIPISTFYSKYYKPILQKEHLSLDKFKKISFLLMFLQNDYFAEDEKEEGCGFVLSDDRNLLVDIDTSHSYYRVAKKLYSFSMPKPSNTANGNKRKVAVVSLHIIPNHIIDRMELSNDQYDVKTEKAKNEKRRGTGYLTLPEIRDVLFTYCTNHNLDNKKDISLNDTLAYVLYQSNKTLKQKYNSKSIPSTITKKDILELWKNCLEPGYAIVKLPSNEIIEMKRGIKPPKISIVVEKRNNKKYITTISGLQAYKVDVMLFSNDVSKRFGCSTSINDALEVVIQGNVANDLQYLVTCGMEGSSSHGNVLDYGNAQEKFVLDYNNFFIPKGACEIILRKGVKPKKK